MKQHTPLLLVLLLLLSAQVIAADASNTAKKLFDEAGGAYSTGNFIQAVELYEQFIGEHGYSPAVLYNLGNSYAALNNPGKAIINYQRGLMLSPSDSDIKSNLKRLKEDQGIFEKDLNIIEKFTNSLTMNQWLWLGLAAISAAAIVTLAALKASLSRSTLTTIYGLCLLTAASAGYSVSTQYKVWHGYIITSPQSRLVISPFAGASPVGDIKAGSLVYMLKEHGDYIYISDENNRMGWLSRTAVERIIP